MLGLRKYIRGEHTKSMEVPGFDIEQIYTGPSQNPSTLLRYHPKKDGKLPHRRGLGPLDSGKVK